MTGELPPPGSINGEPYPDTNRRRILDAWAARYRQDRLLIERRDDQVLGDDSDELMLESPSEASGEELGSGPRQ